MSEMLNTKAGSGEINRRRDVAGAITEKILTALCEGVMPWRKPWDGARVGVSLPRRVTGEPYRGVNVIMLWLASVAHEYRSPYWLTFNQARKLGAFVRRGERGEVVIYYGARVRRDGEAEAAPNETLARFLKSYIVFNANQIEGLPSYFHSAPIFDAAPAADVHEAWFQRLEIERTLSRDIACYIPSRDMIAMPPIAAFDSSDAYAATLNHECVHATAAPHRVGRDLSKRFDRAAYAVEELIAEIGAAILGAHLGMAPGHIADHSAYIESWMKVLEHDKRAFLFAAAQAQNAVDWLLDKSPAPEEIHVAA